MLESGPTVVSGSNGSPTFAPAKTAAYVAMNSSATLSVTMTRLGDTQIWPALPRRIWAASPAARCTSAESSTMNGSEPPSSSTTGLMCSPAWRPMIEPTRSDPVKVTERTRRSAMNREI